MKYILIVVGLFVLGFIVKVIAQDRPKVSHFNYDLMLNSLLGRTVPEMEVSKLSSERRRYTLLDARSVEEFNISHLQGARWVGYTNFDDQRVNDLSKETPILVYCSVGYRSEKITARLKKMGFKEVYNLYGGLFEWVNQGGDVVDLEGVSTTKVHAFDRIWGVWLKRGDKVYP
jgi:rhodanese-related sulfurtransferase